MLVYSEVDLEGLLSNSLPVCIVSVFFSCGTCFMFLSESRLGTFP